MFSQTYLGGCSPQKSHNTVLYRPAHPCQLRHTEPEANCVRFEVVGPGRFAVRTAEVCVTLFPYVQLELSLPGEPVTLNTRQG